MNTLALCSKEANLSEPNKLVMQANVQLSIHLINSQNHYLEINSI
jgi:hypothetical protein